jgi:hypothetical protein
VPYKDGRSIEVSRPASIKRMVRAGGCAAAPVIDGDLDDETWQDHAAEVMGFGWAVENAPEDSTRIRLCHDGSNLYVAVECFDSRPEEVSATVDEHDGFSNPDDTFMLIFQPDTNVRDFHVVSMNPLGTVFDRFVEICPFGSYVIHPEWDVPVSTGARINEAGWVAELSIPIESLGEFPAGKQADEDQISRWGFNFSRWHHRIESSTYFQYPIGYDAAYMGVLRFD